MKMKELFDRGEFVVSAEVGPPKGIHVDELVEEAKTYLKDVHAVNVTDNQSSVQTLVGGGEPLRARKSSQRHRWSRPSFASSPGRRGAPSCRRAKSPTAPPDAGGRQ
mgnify:CR=1 FL=1